MRIRLLLALSLILVVLVSGCAAVSDSPSGFDSQLHSIIQPYAFSFTNWEIDAALNAVQQKISGSQVNGAINAQSVVHYFSYLAQLETLKLGLNKVQAKKVSGDIGLYESKITELDARVDDLKSVVEKTIASQISQVLNDEGIHNPFGVSWFKLPFPAINFKLEKPLYTLIISPRNKIQRIESITIKPDITTIQMEEIENSVNKLNVSALVIPIGGLGATYPTFVVDNADLRWTIDTAAHEWVHQYLAFRPVGFRYILDLLGISQNYSIDTINETVASIVGEEIGALVYNRYYSQYQAPDNDKESSPVEKGFDFNATMRNIRKTVDGYLAQGQVNEAENYMESQRQFLTTKGYYIRKLNQAYFAFYGTYANSPSSVDPIGQHLTQLRVKSTSIKDFLDRVSNLTGGQDLSKMVSQLN
jgi:hypothetical protein